MFCAAIDPFSFAAIPRDALEEVIEPFLLQQGLIQRTPRGRMLAQKAWTHLGMAPPKSQGDMFGA